MSMDGITGVYAPEDSDLIKKIVLATGAIQHRGKASTGIAAGNDEGILTYPRLGRVADVITPAVMRMFRAAHPTVAIGNVGYTKSKIPEPKKAEPLEILPKTTSPYQLVLTMDGYLVKENDLRSELEPDYTLETHNKTEVVGALLHKYVSQEGVSFEAGRKLIDRLHGRATFALIALVNDGRETYLISLSDDRAFEPLCYGVVNGAFVISSESCSHRRLRGFMEREYDGAEMTICSSKGIETKRVREETMMPDAFQGVYFGSVDSKFRDNEIFQLRRKLGLELVKTYKASKGDIVIPNPESGWGVTVGIAEGLQKPLYPALIKLPQAVRTFQEGERSTRFLEVGLKFGGIDSLIKGKNIVMGDDSIVRGSVSEGGSVRIVYNAGATYVEFWVSYGPMFFPSFKEWYRGLECLEELAVQRAFKGNKVYDKSPEEINAAMAKLIGVDEVKYNLPERIQEVLGAGSFQALDGSYPIDEAYWPDWLKVEVEEFCKWRKKS